MSSEVGGTPTRKVLPTQSAEYRRKLVLQVLGPALAMFGLDLEPELQAACVGVFLAAVELGYLFVRRRNGKKVAA